MTTNDDCDHKFTYGGVKYEVQEWRVPGGGAHPVHYYDWFYCEKCLKSEYKKLLAETDSYSPIRFNATPIGEKA